MPESSSHHRLNAFIQLPYVPNLEVRYAFYLSESKCTPWHLTKEIIGASRPPPPCQQVNRSHLSFAISVVLPIDTMAPFALMESSPKFYSAVQSAGTRAFALPASHLATRHKL